MPLLQCLAAYGNWWSKDLTNLFDGPLRQHLALNSSFVLAEGKPFLVMESKCRVVVGGKTTLSTVRYSHREPLTVSLEELGLNSESNAGVKSEAVNRYRTVWCAQIGFAALQKALRRRQLEKLSRLHRVRLFICLLSLLKSVSEIQTDSTSWFWGVPSSTGRGHRATVDKQSEGRRTQLVSILSHYLRYLASHCFAVDSPIHGCFVRSQSGILVSYFVFSVVMAEVRRVIEASDELPKACDAEGLEKISLRMTSSVSRQFDWAELSKLLDHGVIKRPELLASAP